MGAAAEEPSLTASGMKGRKDQLKLIIVPVRRTGQGRAAVINVAKSEGSPDMDSDTIQFGENT